MKQTHTQTHESTTCKLTVLYYTSASRFRLHDRREKLDAQMPAGFTDLASGLGSEAPRKKKLESELRWVTPRCMRNALALEWCGVAM